MFFLCHFFHNQFPISCREFLSIRFPWMYTKTVLNSESISIVSVSYFFWNSFYLTSITSNSTLALAHFVSVLKLHSSPIPLWIFIFINHHVGLLVSHNISLPLQRCLSHYLGTQHNKCAINTW